MDEKKPLIKITESFFLVDFFARDWFDPNSLIFTPKLFYFVFLFLLNSPFSI